jgi:SnoaL-like domain
MSDLNHARQGIEPRLDDPGSDPGHPVRHAVHGSARLAGPQARPPAADPVPGPVRLPRCDPARLLASRAEYETEWADWERSGFQVLGCESSDGRTDRVAPGVVVFTHRVRTRLRDADGEHELHERETIVLRRRPDGRWVGVHEHLSPAPVGP